MVKVDSSLRINLDRLMSDIAALSQFGRDQSGGITRKSFTPAYHRATEWLIQQMNAAGLSARVDAAGNLIGRTGPKTGPVVMTGSHIDTVRNGGPLDGALGVLAGVEVARVIEEHRIPLRLPLEVLSFVDEEGAYLSLFGSTAIAGTAIEENVANAIDGNGNALLNVSPTLGADIRGYADAAYAPGSIKKFVELHIEQGPALEAAGIDIGVVDGIVCLQNIDYRFIGMSNHAGTTPMHLRKDAFRCACEFVTGAYALLAEEELANPSTRMTFGTCSIKPGYSNVIASEALVRMDSRDLDQRNSERLAQRVAEVACETARKYQVDVEIDEKSVNPPARTAPAVMSDIEQVAEQLGYSHMVMSSGAGHDSQAMSHVTDVGMIFVPSIKGLSHHPDEWTSPQDLEKGCNVLLHTLLKDLQ